MAITYAALCNTIEQLNMLHLCKLSCNRPNKYNQFYFYVIYHTTKKGSLLVPSSLLAILSAASNLLTDTLPPSTLLSVGYCTSNVLLLYLIQVSENWHLCNMATVMLSPKSIYCCAPGKNTNLIIQCLFSSPESVWYSKYMTKVKFTVE